MRIAHTFLIIVLVSLCLSSTVDDWNDTVTHQGTGYTVSVPRSWRYMQPPGRGPEHLFEASGHALPATYKGGPVIVTAFIGTFPAASLADAKENTINGYSQNADRVFPTGSKYQEKDFKLSSGQPATLLNTRFFRKSKNLQQSRFDLVAYMPSHKRALFYTLSVQYVDDTYKLEQELKLAELAQKMFGALKLEH
ncbi:MAG: hypothetical protein L0Z53_01105 [Acidobacteriales bacterium]|nr:hypothetical protein [Terriglobales bacterium]